MAPVLLAVAAACSSTAESETLAPLPAIASPGSNGSVHVGSQSRTYIVAEPVVVDATTPVVRAPAHVAFRDGAVSQLNLPVNGRVTKVYVATGDAVKAGDPLLDLTSPDAAAARASAAAANADHDAAVAEVRRQEGMAKSGVGIESELVAARARLRQTEAELARAQATSSLLGYGGGSGITLRAPIDGRVISRRATVGTVAQPGGDPLIEIGNPTMLWVVAEVFDRDLPQVHEGAGVAVELAHGTRSGKVVSIGTALNGTTRAAPVYIALDDDPADTHVRAGMFARAAIKAPAGSSIVLPAEAVLVQGGKSYVVYVAVGDDTYARREVTIGPSVDGKVQVLSGLKAGEKVVMKGALLLDGASEQLL